MDYGIWVGSPEGALTEVTNMIANGTFDTSSGWSFLYTTSSHLSFVDGYLKGIGGTETNVAVRTTATISLTANHVYYCCVKYKKSGGGNTRWGMYNATSGTTSWLDYVEPNADDFTKLSRIYKPTANTSTHFLLYACGSSASTDLVVYWDDLFVIDLTAIYGAGNEPSQSECDGIFAMIDGKVFRDMPPNVAREVEQIFVDGDGSLVAREVTEGWCEVDLVARKFFGIALNLYNYGDGCTDVTGGWEATNAGTSYVGRASMSTVDNAMRLKGSANQACYASPKNKIDLTNYNIIYVDIKSASFANRPNNRIMVTDSKTQSQWDVANKVAEGVNMLSAGVYTLDVSSLTGEYYVGIRFIVNGYSSNDYVDINRVWLE